MNCTSSKLLCIKRCYQAVKIFTNHISGKDQYLKMLIYTELLQINNTKANITTLKMDNKFEYTFVQRRYASDQ